LTILYFVIIFAMYNKMEFFAVSLAEAR